MIPTGFSLMQSLDIEEKVEKLKNAETIYEDVV